MLFYLKIKFSKIDTINVKKEHIFIQKNDFVGFWWDISSRDTSAHQ